MVTLAASAYFLTCCRPAKKSTFCFYVEPPKFINLHSYIQHSPIQDERGVCDVHEQLSDHSLNAPTSCTDDRAWSQDNDRRRRHFLDITSKRIPLCAIGSLEEEKGNPDEIQIEQNNGNSQNTTGKTVPTKKTKENAPGQEQPSEKDSVESRSGKRILEKPIKQEERKQVKFAPPDNQKQDELLKSKELEKEEPGSEKPLAKKTIEEIKPTDQVGKEKKGAQSPASSEFVKSLAEEPLKEIEPDHQEEKEKDIQPDHQKETEVLPPPPSEPKKPFTEKSFTDIDLTPTKEVSEKPQTRAETPDSFSDDVIEKLDFNLVNLEETFDKFVKKNRDFIQSLVKCLSFEKQKQKELEKSYEMLKRENDALRIKNEYLQMVNSKQLQLFKNELDKGLTETKTVYKAKIKQIENQLHSEQEELKYYKQRGKKYLGVVESETEQLKQLKEKLKLHKAREIEILKNFASVLEFLKEVKNSVDTSDLGNESSVKTSESIGDRENRSIRDVLNSALNCGMESLNVRDLSILHDAIQGLNERLCHQNESCGRNTMTNMSPTQLSMVYVDDYCCSDPDCQYRTSQDYANPSCLSLIPSRQNPESKQVCFQ